MRQHLTRGEGEGPQEIELLVTIPNIFPSSTTGNELKYHASRIIARLFTHGDLTRDRRHGTGHVLCGRALEKSIHCSTLIPGKELTVNGVYRLTPDGTFHLLVDDFAPDGCGQNPRYRLRGSRPAHGRHEWSFRSEAPRPVCETGGRDMIAEDIPRPGQVGTARA